MSPSRRRWHGRAGGWSTCLVWRKWSVVVILAATRRLTLWKRGCGYSGVHTASQPCHSRILQLVLVRVYQIFFLRVSEVFQPRFALATRNLVHIVLMMSISASTHSVHLAALGALDQRWEINDDLMTTGWRIVACKAQART